MIQNPVNAFPDIEHVQVQPNILVGFDPRFPECHVHNILLQLNHFPQQQVAPYPPQAAFAHPSIHRIPIPNQQREVNLRRLANRYMDHLEGQIRVVSTEEGIDGGYKTMIIVETPDIP